MKKKNTKNGQKASPEKVTAQEALKRVKGFAKRKEKFIAAIKESKN